MSGLGVLRWCQPPLDDFWNATGACGWICMNKVKALIQCRVKSSSHRKIRIGSSWRFDVRQERAQEPAGRKSRKPGVRESEGQHRPSSTRPQRVVLSVHPKTSLACQLVQLLGWLFFRCAAVAPQSGGPMPEGQSGGHLNKHISSFASSDPV